MDRFISQTYDLEVFNSYFINSTEELFINEEGDLLIYYRFEYGK